MIVIIWYASSQKPFGFLKSLCFSQLIHRPWNFVKVMWLNEKQWNISCWRNDALKFCKYFVDWNWFDAVTANRNVHLKMVMRNVISIKTDRIKPFDWCSLIEITSEKSSANCSKHVVFEMCAANAVRVYLVHF